MKRAVFEIKQNSAANYYFTFKNSDDVTLIISCSFPDRAELEKCLSGVRDAAPLAEVSIYPDSSGNPPFFEIQSKKDGCMFSLVGFQGEILFTSVFYSEEKLCRESIHTFKTFSQKAAIVDLTEN